MIKLSPATLDKTYEKQLQVKLEKWKVEYNNWLLKNSRDTIDMNVLNLFEKTKYQYSYFQTYEPIEVYRTDLNIEINGIKNFKLFIGIKKDGHIYSDYKEDGWVLNSCDSINSIIQNVYGQMK